MIIFLILIVTIWFFSKKNERFFLWKEKLIRQPFNYYLLIGLLIVGFFFRLDYSERYGDIVFPEPILTTKNILFSFISLLLVLLSFFSKKRIIKLSLISLELLFWLFKLSFYKGGYLVGFVEGADPLISLYDTTTFVLRLFIMSSLMKIKISQIYILICTLIVMMLKIHIFPMPYSDIIKKRKWQMEDIRVRNYFFISEWIENSNAEKKVRIVFLPSKTIIYNLQNNDSLLFRPFYNVWAKGKTILRPYMYVGEDCIFEFIERGDNTINASFRYKGENYYTQMNRKNDSHCSEK